MQVCPGPQNVHPPPACFTVDTSVIGGRAFADYFVTQPGSLYFDSAARRLELANLSPDTSALYCAVNPAARTRASLPTLTFASSRLHIDTQQWTQSDGVVNAADVARLTYVDLRTSDGLVIPEIELAFSRARPGGNQQPLTASFWVTGMASPPRIHTKSFGVDPATGAFVHERFVSLPETERRLVFALFDGLRARLTAAGPGTTAPGPVGPPWTLAAVLESAAHFESAVFATPQPRFGPVVALNCSVAGSYQTCTEEPALFDFADYLQRYGADYLASGDPAMRVGLLDNLRTWAAANALSAIPGIAMGQSNQPDFVPKYTLLKFLMPTITTWSLLRPDPLVTPADRALIDGWIDRVAAYATEPFGGPGNEHMPWNPGYLTLAVRMAWGVVRGNDAAVAEGVERILMGLYQMRPDGSFPREVARGACALSYHVLQTHHLIVLAELAARQGYDAYALRVEGKSLHDAVKFIVDVVDKPSLIAGYAATDAANCGLPSDHPLSMPGVVGEGDTFYAWIEPYLARFPTHPHAERVRALERGGLAANRPIHNIYAGANTTCLFAEHKSVMKPDLNQHGLTGFWYEAATSGQGFGFEVFPNPASGTGSTFLTWFSYDTIGGGAERQRWYSAQGSVAEGQPSAALTIYQNTGGNFNAPPPTNAQAIGTATLSFDSCSSGQLSYAFTDGTGRTGTIPLTRLMPNVTCSTTGSYPTNPDLAFSGHWFGGPATSGQGFAVEVNPNARAIFAAWYTYVPNGTAAGVAGQRWYSAQGPFTAGLRSIPVTIYETTGGVFDTATPPGQATVPVGTGTIAFQGCAAATFSYTFTGASSSGLSGTINLTRVGPAPPGCAQ